MSGQPSPRSSCVCVFLSVDLAGSTRLKNVLNLQELAKRYVEARKVVDAIVAQENGPLIPEPLAEGAVLRSLQIGVEDFDWSHVVESFYNDFHEEFLARRNATQGLLTDADKVAFPPWKAVGDELIYVFEAASRRDLHHIVVDFLAAMRTIDEKISVRSRSYDLRLKGSAWTAGFPIRNRRIRVPGKDGDGVYDYLGPEIDTGFRIGKCTRPGMLAVSVELAELLGEIPTDMRPMTGMIVGWESLKGVWGDKPYPVVWVDFPDQHLPHLGSRNSDDWESLESRFSKEWKSVADPKPSITKVHDHLVDIRKSLPEHLGIVDPYIVGDRDALVAKGGPETIPPQHIEIQDLLGKVDAFSKKAALQDADGPCTDTVLDASGVISSADDDAIRVLVEQAVPPPNLDDPPSSDAAAS